MRFQWISYTAGTWQPLSHNEYHNCTLFLTEHGGVKIRAHKTEDGKWISHAFLPNRAVPYGKSFHTRKAAAVDAWCRLAREMPTGGLDKMRELSC